MEVIQLMEASFERDNSKKFETDDETDAILMIGEIGGPQEVAAGEFAKENMKKPVIGHIRINRS